MALRCCWRPASRAALGRALRAGVAEQSKAGSGRLSSLSRGFATAASGLHQLKSPSFGFLFDIDGVLLRGRLVIPAAKKAFQKLTNVKGHFRVPVGFLTNAGNCSRDSKAEELTEALGFKVSPEWVILSHSPLQLFHHLHDRCVLVCGQGPVEQNARDLGFQHILTIEDIRKAFPLLDMVDQKRRPKELPPPTIDFPTIEGIILLGEPVRWETCLQLIIDILLSNGNPGVDFASAPYPHIPIVACNMDLLWMAEAKMPRDNPMADIYGANLYHRYLQAQAEVNVTAMAAEREKHLETQRDCNISVSSVKSCHSILVCTGVYNPHGDIPTDPQDLLKTLSHGHRDFHFDPSLVEASYVVHDVNDAVELVFQKENWKQE
ncbi:haloacid dehalogenase-like hydrolase domain-containing 5 isoform X2 [Ahaetulla prasina]|uniref:haloacid dehalogenase-like hydrolase domain-containing 5 isoform X2 n=1 Tax=Ahaetulla prasina TaxID=499056 RepID=UPI00264809E9|nr:haloacid dehalogenase-like hydrolase domain-containing 5 isoform X2 [Ahaetulla prasina]